MKTADETGDPIADEARVLSGLTGYPEAVIRDVIEADRMYVLDRVCEDMRDVGVLPDRYAFPVAGLGRIRLIRLSGGKTTDSRWEFLPTPEFRDRFFDSFYYGKSPTFERMEANFNDLMAERSANLLRSRI